MPVAFVTNFPAKDAHLEWITDLRVAEVTCYDRINIYVIVFANEQEAAMFRLKHGEAIKMIKSTTHEEIRKIQAAFGRLRAMT